MSSLQVLIGLGAGLLLGIAASLTGSPLLLSIIDVVEPLGTIFIRGIQMTVIPLVVSILIVGVASASNASGLARLGGRGVLLFATLALAAATFTAAIAAPLLARLRLDPSVVASLREGLSGDGAALTEGADRIPGLAQWFVDLVPANPVAAAAGGTMLPLIVFTLGFAAALSQLPAESRGTIVAFFGGLADAMMMLVGWVLWTAPVGVFALAAPLGARMGVAAAGALFYYIGLAMAITTVFVVFVLYPITIGVGRIPLRRFAREAAPAQAVAFSSRSTMATLPAMIDAASRMGLPASVTGFLVPLAASIFRVGSAVGQTIGVLFAAQLYGATPTLPQLATIVLTVVITTFTVPGIPGGSIIVMVPIMLAANLPVEGIAILLGADTIPDMFRTTANVTGGIAAAAMLGGREAREETEGDGEPAPT